MFSLFPAVSGLRPRCEVTTGNVPFDQQIDSYTYTQGLTRYVQNRRSREDSDKAAVYFSLMDPGEYDIHYMHPYHKVVDGSTL